jgi:hypothetical protein
VSQIATDQKIVQSGDPRLDHLRRDPNFNRRRIAVPVDLPRDPSPGALAFLFVQRLCDRLERDGKLPADEAGRIWAGIMADLQTDGRSIARQCEQALIDLKLAKK